MTTVGGPSKGKHILNKTLFDTNFYLYVVMRDNKWIDYIKENKLDNSIPFHNLHSNEFTDYYMNVFRYIYILVHDIESYDSYINIHSKLTYKRAHTLDKVNASLPEPVLNTRLKGQVYKDLYVLKIPDIPEINNILSKSGYYSHPVVDTIEIAKQLIIAIEEIIYEEHSHVEPNDIYSESALIKRQTSRDNFIDKLSELKKALKCWLHYTYVMLSDYNVIKFKYGYDSSYKIEFENYINAVKDSLIPGSDIIYIGYDEIHIDCKCAQKEIKDSLTKNSYITKNNLCGHIISNLTIENILYDNRKERGLHEYSDDIDLEYRLINI